MMYRPTLISIIILSLLNWANTQFNCGEFRNRTLCDCSESANRGYDIECPNSISPQVQISFDLEQAQDFDVDCRSNFDYVDFLPKKYLPHHMRHLKLNSLRFKWCSLPHNTSVRDVMNVLEIESTKKMRIHYSNMTGITRSDLDGLQPIETLEVIDNEINILPKDLLYDLENLTNLDLRSNNVEIPQEFFKMSHKLKVLELAQNTLPKNTTDMFDSLKEIVLLNVWMMQINEINGGLFKSLTKLKIMDLSLNLMENIPRELFGNLEQLQELSLRRNKFRSIPQGLFENNTKLEILNLDENYYLSSAPEKMLANLPHLRYATMVMCNFSSVPENFFWGSRNLVSLNMSHNTFETLPDQLFRDLTALEDLKLNNNQLRYLPNRLFQNVKNLRELNLDHNWLHLTPTTFYGLNKLTNLYLQHNELVALKNNIWGSLQELEVLDLSYNELTMTGSIFNIDELSPIANLMKLKKLLLSHNNISKMFSDWRIRPNLRTLDLRHNKFERLSIYDFNFIQNAIEVNLEHNNINDVNMDEAETIFQGDPNEPSKYFSSHKNITIKLADNPFHCGCNLYSLYRYYDGKMDPQVYLNIDLKPDNVICKSPESMAGMPLTKIKSEIFVCDIIDNPTLHKALCPVSSNCFLKPFTKTLVIDNSYQGITEAPKLSEHMMEYHIDNIVANISGNNLTRIPKRGLGYENVTVLDLSNNNIDGIEWLPENLEALLLHGNNISVLNTSEFTLFNRTNFQMVTLYDNPWKCDCDAVDFMKYLQDNYKKVNNLHNITCHGSKLELASLTYDQLCPMPKEVIIFLSVTVAFVSLICAILAGLYYRYSTEVKVWLFAHHLCLWFVTEEEVDKDKIYDAFISYSHKDEDFIVTELLPNLEEGPKPYKLCLHFRNWQPGEFIQTNIARSVAESRRTIVILSPSFLSSEWGKMEFRTAHKQALNESRARVIVVLLGDIPMDDLDDELKAYLSTNTYVKWGDPWFWDKLRYALPHCPKYMKQNCALEKIKICDDKLDLINEPSTPPIGTTPPADKVNFDPLLKDGALNVALVNGTLINNCVNSGRFEQKIISNSR